MQTLQKRLQLLRRVHRLLASDHTDPFLCGLQLYGLESLNRDLLSATAQAAIAHKKLIAAFESRIAGDGLGVVQHAVCLLREIDLKVGRGPCSSLT